MRILLAGASGVVGRALLPKLVAAGHSVAGTSRHADRLAAIEAAGATGLAMDALDPASTAAAVLAARPDVVIHQLTDLSTLDFAANSRLRVVGTRNLVDAARAAGVQRMIAQSIAWIYAPGDGPAAETDPLDDSMPAVPAVRSLEDAVSEMPVGVVLRYGRLYGPGTFYGVDGSIAEDAWSGTLPGGNEIVQFLHVDDAADAAVAALEWPAGAVNIVDDDPATGDEWRPVFCRWLGVDPPAASGGPATGRVVSAERARRLGWRPAHPTWRTSWR